MAERATAEELEAAETRLKESKDELERVRRQMTAQEQQLRAGHAEQMREVNLEKDKLTGSVDQLKVRMKRSDAEEGQDMKETKQLQCVREWGSNNERFGGTKVSHAFRDG